MSRTFAPVPLLVAAGLGAGVFALARLGPLWKGALTGATIQVGVRLLGVS